MMKTLLTALAFAGAAQAATLTPAPADAQKTIASAQAGDVIKLTGQVPALNVVNKSSLTIDASAAQLPSVFIKGSTGITWTGGRFTPNDWVGAVYVQSSKTVSVSGIKAAGGGTFNGVFFRDSQDVSLTDASLERTKVGVNFLNVTGGRVAGSAIFGSAIDGVDLASSTDVTIEQNTISGAMLVDDHHPDAVQMWTVQGGVKTARVTIRKNMFHGASQGSSLFSHFDWDGCQAVTIEDNVYELSYPQAIALSNCPGSIVQRNVVRTLPGAKWRASINLDATVTRSGNRVEAYGNTAAVIDPN